MAKENEEEERVEQQGEPLVEAEKKITVDLTEEDDAEDTSDKPESRRSRRTERRELKEALRTTQEKLSAMEQRLADLQARANQPVYQQPAEQVRPAKQEDPEDSDEIAAIERQQVAIQAAITNRDIPDAQAQAYAAEYRKLDRKKNRLMVQSELARERGNGTQAAAQMAEDYARAQLHSEFPEIYSNPVWLAYAQAENEQLIHVGRRPRNAATAREALMNLRRRLQPPTPAATAEQRARYVSTPRSAGTQSSGNQFVPSKAQLNTALAYTQHLSHLSDEERVRKWVKDVAKPSGLVR